MKNFFSLLILTAIFPILMVPDAFSQIQNVATDSSNFSQDLSSNNRIIQNHDNSHQPENQKFDYNESLPTSSGSSIKIFKPDTTLTDSMPILKTKPVDQGIFIPEFNFMKPDSLD